MIASARRLWPGLLTLMVTFVAGLVLWDRMPSEVPLHWNLRGEPDRWGSPAELIFVMPAVGLALALLFIVLPRLDPKRENYAMHGDAYWLTGNAVLILFACIHGAVMTSSAGYPVNVPRVLAVATGLCLAVIGNVLTRARQNWFFGIRTPWTLTSERAWRETHRLGGRLMVLGGLGIALIGLLAPRWLFPGILLGAIVPGVVSVVHSYLVWKRELDHAEGGA